jgi:hypothetical protein
MVAFQAIEMQEDDADETPVIVMQAHLLEIPTHIHNDNRLGRIEERMYAKSDDFVAPRVLLNVCCCSVIMGAGIGHMCSSSADHLSNAGFLAGVSNVNLGAFTGLVGAGALLSLPPVNRAINRLLHSKTD